MRLQTASKKADIQPEDLSEIQVIFRLLIAIALVWIIYSVPSYSFMFKPISDHTGAILNFLGISHGRINGVGGYYGFEINGGLFYIVKACTGMQAGAILLTLIIVTPVGSNSLRKKLVAGIFLLLILYFANVLRIAFHMLLISKGIPFSIAHDMLSKPIGFVGTILFALAIERLGVPILDQFSIFLDTIWYRIKSLLRMNSVPEPVPDSEVSQVRDQLTKNLNDKSSED